MKLHPIILCGGSGTRLWPLSRTLLPKQFLPLVAKYTMLQETVLRSKGLDGLAAPIVVCSSEHRFLAAEQLREVGVEPAAQILEPAGRNTAPAVAVAALAVAQSDAGGVMLVLPADHLIRDVPRFHRAVAQAAVHAQAGKLVTFGIVCKTPETGYGYIERGGAIPGANGSFAVARFVEKPDAARARQFVEAGTFYWNSGMFVFRADRYLEELSRFRPDILRASQEAWERRSQDLDFCRLDTESFTRCPAESIDYAVMEKTRDAVVVEADIGWSDIGSWASLWQVCAPDAQGNVTQGDVHLDGVRNSYVRAESRLVAAIGVEDLVIVETPDALLVTKKEHAQRVKDLVDALKAKQRDEYLVHRRVYRPWGYYEGLDSGERFQVKRIMVKPGCKLSLQMHHHRAEHWVVVSGTARVVRGEDSLLLSENQSTYIPLGVRHRLENVGKVPLHLIEVQSGGYLGEDDIVRFEDDYNRKG
ncbi:MAG TPA: mannose-1-phosphate guanylyltransferase/mannose-6-phosphate isomerase [Burkholderiales bacterium]|nr:mannose-1-phosphate guanylyltransferase/mannose-6-phosphate isomerase [Burkholderiales bacterium]